MNNMNIIFYSRRCETCINLINILESEKLLNYFKLFCVDGRINDIPPQITMVPTVIVQNINKPMTGSEVFEWIKSVKYLRKQNIDNNNNINNSNNNNFFNDSDKNVIGWNSQEMNGKSDSYAYQSDLIDKPFAHSYFSIGDERNNVIFTAPETNKIKKNDQVKLIQSLENNRTSQDQQYSKLQKEQQLNELLKITNNNNHNNI